MALRDQDRTELERRGTPYECHSGSGEILLIMPGHRLPTGLHPEAVTLLVRVPSLFPAVPPDMFWVDPAIRRTDGQTINATQVSEQIFDRSWQRWSRHLQPNQWRADCDDIGTYIDIIDQCLRAAAEE